MKLKKWQQNLLLFTLSSLFALVFVEFALRLLKPHERYFSLVPEVNIEQYNRFHTFFPGIDSVFHYEVNEAGYRSASEFNANRYGILTIGGSTTHCVGLSNADSWPWLIEEQLNQVHQNQKFTVGNVGELGHHSGNHLLQLKYLEPQFENIKMVLILAGINDFNRFYLSDSNYLPTRKDQYLLERTFVQFPRKAGPTWYKRSELWMHFMDNKNSYKTKKTSLINTDIEGARKQYKEAKKSLDLQSKKYVQSKKSNQLIDLTNAVEDFEKNIKDILLLAKQRNIKVVLMTQPTLWHSEMTAYEEKLAAPASRKVGDAYLTPGSMERGLELFNDKLREVSSQNEVYLIDLARQLPQDTSVFFDYCHFNKSGSKKVADLIFNKLDSIFIN